MFIYMPLMKVRREDDTGWYTVDHLNFNYIGLGINEPITLVQSNNKAENLNKIYVYNGKDDYPYDGTPKEELLYKSTMEEELKANWMPKLLEANTESTEAEQKNINITEPVGQKNTLLLEHRKLTDKNDEIFHILNYWDDTNKKWIPLNNIWG